MKRCQIFVLLMSFLIQYSCNDKHLISDIEYRNLVERSFQERKKLAEHRSDALFSVFNGKLPVEQAEALKFLYAFMPLSDLADYNGDFFLANVRMSLRAREETSWGKVIPEDIFLHYVLPCRINNENLDSFRIAYYDEIHSRIKGMNLEDAALEINHWCHEKVSYQPADIRTSAPMSTILSARGRCGEESTFTVAALRTAGIPARQVYTPRWAHSDDNHAWVEIWNNGKWNYMGACEPEPVTDRGWFTEPARRAMLVHTKSFGANYGNENFITRNRNYTEVNNLAKYAITKTIAVKVSDRDGKPVNGAIVEFQLYNYSEFYPLAKVPADENGISRFETGLGDLLVWAYRGNDFNFRKISVAETDTLELTLNAKRGPSYKVDLDLGVPPVLKPLPGPSKELQDANAARITNENNIRQKYINTWMTKGEAGSIAIALSLDTARVWKIFERSMGNYREIRSFLESIPGSLRKTGVAMLELLPDKDLRDTKAYILSDHLLNSPGSDTGKSVKERDIFLNYILNPRVANEIITDWRGYFRKNLAPDFLIKTAADPSNVVDFLNKNINIADGENYYKTPLTPKGVYELGVSDSFSRAIAFVALCRTAGVPSRLEPGSLVPQYMKDGKWTDVYFAGQEKPSGKKGYIRLVSDEKNPVPEYYIHFTLARFVDGRYNTLEYDYNRKITDFTQELELVPGSYMLVTGNRLNDSRILSDLSFFELAENEHKTLEVKLRKENLTRQDLGKIDLGEITGLFREWNIAPEKLVARGVTILWIDPEKEPTKHIFNDLPLLRNELDSWGGYFLFLYRSDTEGIFEPASVKGLPANSLFAFDDQMVQLRKISGCSATSDVSLPYIVAADSSGKILFQSAGYRIGIGEQILKHVK